jgi:hypothetical protein
MVDRGKEFSDVIGKQGSVICNQSFADERRLQILNKFFHDVHNLLKILLIDLIEVIK